MKIDFNLLPKFLARAKDKLEPKTYFAFSPLLVTIWKSVLSVHPIRGSRPPNENCVLFPIPTDDALCHYPVS